MPPESWSVLIETEAIAGEQPVDFDRIEELLDILGPYSPSATYSANRYGCRFAVEQPTWLAAVDTAVMLWQEASQKADLPDWPVILFEVTASSALEASLEEPNFPQLLGVGEVARLVGVSKQRVSELARGRNWPRPVVTLSSGPVWLESTIRQFVAQWDRRPGPKQAGKQGESAAKRPPAQRREKVSP